MRISSRPIIIPCGAKKLAYAAPAYKMYLGGYYRTMLDTAIRLSPHVYILSAGYGLLALSDVIEPYDIQMTHLRAKQFKEKGVCSLDAFLLLPKMYREACVYGDGPHMFDGLRMGEQMSAARKMVAQQQRLIKLGTLPVGGKRSLLDI